MEYGTTTIKRDDGGMDVYNNSLLLGLASCLWRKRIRGDSSVLHNIERKCDGYRVTAYRHVGNRRDLEQEE